MTPSAREWVAGSVSAAGVLGLAALHLPVAAVLPIGLALYAGLRLSLPAAPPAPPALPWNARFFADAEAALAGMTALHARLPPGTLRAELEGLLATSGKLLLLFRTKPDRMEFAQLFPDHLQKLADLLQRYVQLRSDLAEDAANANLAQSEAVFAQARRNLADLRERLLHQDLAELNANARVCDDLLKL